MNKPDSYYAEIIWNYMLMNHEMKKMDAIFILGSNDLRVADRAAELYHQGLAKYVICSGGNGKNSMFEKTEAETFSDRLIELSVPREKILLESRATNTGDNIEFTKQMIKEKKFDFNSFILVQKPYMERRTYATFKKRWPEPEIIVTSPQLTFDEFTNDERQKKHWETMVGDLQRIKEYPKLGYQIEQDIPDEVLEAWKTLVDRGYTKYYIDDFDIVSFSPSEEFNDIVQKVYEEQSQIIMGLLGDIKIHHIGGTSIPGLLTKGDLDVNIRVEQKDFQNTIKKLKEHYFTAQIANWSDTFASFKDHRLEIDFGIQVCVIDSEDDHFLKHQRALINNPEKIEEFNELKKSFEGKEMRDYRIGKSSFLKTLCNSVKNSKKIEIKEVGSYFKVDEQGFIINPTSLEKIQSQWEPVIEEVSKVYQDIYDANLENVYIRGSVAKGQAVENISDIDTFAYVNLDKDDINYEWVNDAERIITKKYPFVEGVEFSVSPISSTNKNHIILNQSLCVYGRPIDVPRLKIDKNLAIHAPNFINRINRFKDFYEQEKTPEQVKSHCVWQMKGLLRVGAEITLERSRKYTRDLYKCYEVFSEYYPEKEQEMRDVLDLALNPTDDKDIVKGVMDSFGSWLLDESKKHFI